MSTALRPHFDHPREPGESSGAGYRHRLYAESFFESGACVELPNCGGWIVRRAIPGSDLHDAMGCYPLFACRDWSRLGRDLDTLNGLVSLTLVTDPFANIDLASLSRVFKVVRPFKQHHVVEAARVAELPVTRHHRRNLRRARRVVRVEQHDADRLLEEFVELYGVLQRRHGIWGIRAFSHDAIARQLRVPGIVAFRATVDGALAGIHLWYVDGDVAFAHLGATNELGYTTMASYALYAGAIEALSTCVRWLDLGAAPGLEESAPSHGLVEFKRGFATATRPVFLCGKVFDPKRYEELAEPHEAGAYFPGYRVDGFTG